MGIDVAGGAESEGWQQQSPVPEVDEGQDRQGNGGKQVSLVHPAPKMKTPAIRSSAAARNTNR